MAIVSVIIPAYNRARLLEAAAATVLRQTFEDLELIVVDDGSWDDTRAVCARLGASDPRVRYIYQENKGLPAARNTGIRAARGTYIALLDSDDTWEPTKLAKQLPLLEKGADIGVVYCEWAPIDSRGEISPASNPPNTELPTLFESLLYFNVIHGSASAVVIRAECFDRVGLFDESLRSLEDWDMWFRIAQHYEFAKIPEVLVYLLQHEGQMQRRNDVMADSLLVLSRKFRNEMPPQYMGHLARMQWHHYLLAAELYCAGSRTKTWRALAKAVQSWPSGVLSPRTWYILILSLAGPLYPRVNATGINLRKRLRQRLKMDPVTGWRGRLAR